MRKKYQKILLAAIIMAVVVVLPLLVAAAGLQLETNFPTAPGTEEVVTGKTQLPNIIRYVVNWSIIIAALAVVVALVTAGIQYLTSVGRPNATQAARSRIKNCLYGLLIIAGSFLILQTINPQLTIMTIQRKAVGSSGGVVMFTQAGLYGNGADGVPNQCYNFNADKSPNTGQTIPCINPEAVSGINTSQGDTLETLIKAGAARFLNYDIANTLTEFGKFIPGDAGVTSVNFPLYGLGFFGDAAGQAETKIFAYPEAQFNVSTEATANRVIEYRPGGKMNKEGTDIDPLRKSYSPSSGSPADELKMTLINVYEDYVDNFKSMVPYYDSSASTQEKKADKAHPPLSIRRQGGGTGVILFADSGGMKNFTATVEDFNLSNVKFDNQADQIELHNWIKNPDKSLNKIHNYLAILHSGYYFTGDIRYFFETIGPISVTLGTDPYLRLPKIYEHEDFYHNAGGIAVDITKLEKDPKYFGNGTGVTVAKYCGVDGCDCSKGGGDCVAGGGLGEPASNFDDAFFFYPSKPLADFGNITNYLSYPSATGWPRISINSMDQFGRLKADDKASSLQLFELEAGQGIYGTNTNYEGTDKAGTEPTDASKQKIVCREVKLCTSKGYMGDCLVFVPNIPGYIKSKFSARNRYDSIVLPMPFYAPINIPTWLKGWVKTYDDKGATVIKDKDIEFADKIKSISIDGDCAVILFENSVKNFAKCAADCKASAKCSECWDGGGPGANSEVFTESVSDLTTHEISKCGGREKFGFGERKNCASSIAIFPIKKVSEEQGQ